jgi:hypothetical protein
LAGEGQAGDLGAVASARFYAARNIEALDRSDVDNLGQVVAGGSSVGDVLVLRYESSRNYGWLGEASGKCRRASPTAGTGGNIVLANSIRVTSKLVIPGADGHHGFRRAKLA